MADSKSSKQDAKPDPGNPWQSQDAAHQDEYKDLDPTKVVGDYAMQPDPNSDRPAPLPNVPEGVNKAPADDDEGAGALGAGNESTSS